jgi:hypothetical protein
VTVRIESVQGGADPKAILTAETQAILAREAKRRGGALFAVSVFEGCESLSSGLLPLRSAPLTLRTTLCPAAGRPCCGRHPLLWAVGAIPAADEGAPRAGIDVRLPVCG